MPTVGSAVRTRIDRASFTAAMNAARQTDRRPGPEEGAGCNVVRAGSSGVERAPVERVVAGSNPVRCADRYVERWRRTI
jgi:hypothetical protein